MAKKRSVVPIGKIRRNLEKIWVHCPERTKAKKRAKIDTALYKCEIKSCNKAVYDGVSDKNYQKTVEKWPKHDIIRGVIEIDHIDPVIDPKNGFVDWNTYMERRWVPAECYQAICRECHLEKSAIEDEQRVKHGTLKRKKNTNRKRGATKSKKADSTSTEGS